MPKVLWHLIFSKCQTGKRKVKWVRVKGRGGEMKTNYANVKTWTFVVCFIEMEWSQTDNEQMRERGLNKKMIMETKIRTFLSKKSWENYSGIWKALSSPIVFPPLVVCVCVCACVRVCVFIYKRYFIPLKKLLAIVSTYTACYVPRGLVI